MSPPRTRRGGRRSVNAAKSWQERLPGFIIVSEAAAVNATESLSTAMDENRVSRGEMARRLGISQPAVTQMLRGDHALGVRTLARYAIAMGLRVTVGFVKETDPLALRSYDAALERAAQRDARSRRRGKGKQ